MLVVRGIGIAIQVPDLTQKVGPTGILFQELFEEWDWPEHFAAQPDTLRYLNYVADKFDFRRDIKFDRRVEACVLINRIILDCKDKHEGRICSAFLDHSIRAIISIYPTKH